MTWMTKAIILAESGRYSCAPNPMVGCIIVKNNQLISEGAHLKAGCDHAEIYALKTAGTAAKDADVYITLEPCCHYGQTPPCVDKLIEAQVKRVHIAISDPNPRVSGQGIAKLRSAGIEVIVGQSQEAAYQLNKVFSHYIHHRTPFLIAKWAMSLDGKIAISNGESRWITSTQARAHVHDLRSQVGAVMVGAGTIIKDNPLLNNRHQSASRQPRPIVITGKGRIPFQAKVFTERDDILVITSEQADQAFLNGLKQRDIDHIITPLHNGILDLQAAMMQIAARGISSVLVEGGQQLLTHCYEKKLINRLYTYIAPKIVGGSHSLTPIGGQDIGCITKAMSVIPQQIIPLGNDICLMSELAITAQTYEQFLKQTGGSSHV